MEDKLKNSVGIVKTQHAEIVSAEKPLSLDCGRSLEEVTVAYETYGELNAKKDNAILVCHALSGNAHLAGYNSESDKKPGWWEEMVGPGKSIDTNKYFVICSNILGGCSGTTGPASINPKTQKPYGLDFPIITIGDMVNVQKLLIDFLGIEKLLAVLGGSMGGMQVLQWATSFPQTLNSAIVIASTTTLSSQSIGFDAIGRHAILADKSFNNGKYYGGENPNEGLSIARMIAHITYLSEESMHRKFGRTLRKNKHYTYDFDSEFSVETYLDYQGQNFVERFDANSYLYITKAIDYFDLAKPCGSLEKAFEKCDCRFLIVSFSSDWLFTPQQSEEMVNALVASERDVSYCNIKSHYGHDAFLLETETLGSLMGGFIKSTEQINSGKISEPVEKPSSRDFEEPITQAKRTRVDYQLIESLIEPRSRVLDVGCGDGELLSRLIADKKIDGEGLELTQEMVMHCVNRGLAVIHRDIERKLEGYADNSFDFVILSQTLQTLYKPKKVFKELLRVGKKVIVSFPNFAYWKTRASLGLTGKAPITKQLPFGWYNSPNIHFLSLKDFEKFCDDLDVVIEKKIPMVKNRLSPVKFAPNLLAEQAIYLCRTP